MAPTRRPSDGLLARVNFPLYAVDMLTSRHILVAGGGGSSKTGVANGFVSVSNGQMGRSLALSLLSLSLCESGTNYVLLFSL